MFSLRTASDQGKATILSGDHANFYDLRDVYGDAHTYHDGGQQRAHYLNDDELVLSRLDEFEPYDGQATMFQFHLMSAHGLGRRHDKLRLFRPDANYYSWPVVGGLRGAASADEASAAVNYYDNGVHQVDYYVDEILKRLRDLGYLEKALVVIVGDHGEMLGERNHFGHQKQVEEPTLSIPMAFIRFGYTGQPFRTTFASQLDVAPTVMSELDLASPGTWVGKSLQDPDIPRVIPFQQGQMAGLYHVNGEQVYKYWYDGKTDAEYVYELIGDPSEGFNRVGTVDTALLTKWRGEIRATKFVKAINFD